MIRLFFPFFIVCALAVAIPASMILLSYFVGPRKYSPIKMQPYESGVPTTVPVVRGRLSVKFFLVAMLFLIFDIEVVFLFPWASVFRSLGSVGLIEMGLFLLVLIVGLVYAMRKGAFEWE
ncbi:MAG: NADH-quinone oxidoreductase subunit A [Chitinivibrionales bacterium]|nr:NADH-quinone oxidoreductase subunit A [Chitinivibrionales bacterium]